MSVPKLKTLASASRLSGICLGLCAALTFGLSAPAFGGGDCGVGDVVSIEACLVDEDVDDTNGGCNSDPDVFETANLGGTMEGTVSTYLITVACVDDAPCAPNETCVGGFCLAETRDTDWYHMSQAALEAADTDGNGWVQIKSTLSSEFDGVTFFISFNPNCDTLGFPGNIGFSAPNCAGGTPALATINTNDHPAGLVVFVSSGEDDGTPIRSGFECVTGNNDYLLTLESIDPFAACEEGAGDCGDENNGTPGCEDVACCQAVCEADENCCFGPWDDVCVFIAVNEIGCVTPTCDSAAEIIVDHIGGNADNLGLTIFASQIFPDFPTFSIVAADSVTVPAPGFVLSCAEVVIDGFGDGLWQDNFDNVTQWNFEIYSSAEAAATNLVGDVASFVGAPVSIEVFGGFTNIAHFDLSAGPGPGFTLAPGTYYIGLLPTMIFDNGAGCCGQTAVFQSLIGNGDAVQANPGGGFEFVDNLSLLNANLAYRLIGDPGKGGGGTVHADAFNAFRGFLDSGTLADTLTSDDVDLCHDLGITIFPAEAPITLDFDGQLPTDSPASLDVTFESSANTPGLGLTILMWNYNTNSWEEIGTAAQGFNVDTVRTFAATPADHVEPGTGNVRTRYEVRQTGIIFAFPWTDCIDEMFWTHN